MPVSPTAQHYIGKIEMKAIDIPDVLERLQFYERSQRLAYTELADDELPKAYEYLQKRFDQLADEFRRGKLGCPVEPHEATVLNSRPVVPL